MTPRRWFLVGAAVVLGVLVWLPFPPFRVYPVVLLDILCWALFALAFDLVFGQVGLLSFGHAAFWGTSAYVTGWMLLHLGVGVPLAMLGGTAAAFLIAIPVGFLSIRSVGIYFSMITLAFGQMVEFIAKQWDEVTGGDSGLPNIPRPPLLGLDFSNSLHAYWFGLVVAGLGALLVFRTIHSPFGAALRAIRDNDIRAQSVGYATWAHKVLAFLLSAALSGLAGALYVVAHGVVSLDVLSWTTSGQVVMTALLGGTGTFLGPPVGSAVTVLLRDLLSRSAAAPLGLVTGLVFVVTVLFFRRGIVGTVSELWARRKARTPRRAAE
jgi:branched-chain amino acid transport system permease protein